MVHASDVTEWDVVCPMLKKGRHGIVNTKGTMIGPVNLTEW